MAVGPAQDPAWDLFDVPSMNVAIPEFPTEITFEPPGQKNGTHYSTEELSTFRDTVIAFAEFAKINKVSSCVVRRRRDELSHDRARITYVFDPIWQRTRLARGIGLPGISLRIGAFLGWVEPEAQFCPRYLNDNIYYSEFVYQDRALQEYQESGALNAWILTNLLGYITSGDEARYKEFCSLVFSQCNVSLPIFAPATNVSPCATPMKAVLQANIQQRELGNLPGKMVPEHEQVTRDYTQWCRNYGCDHHGPFEENCCPIVAKGGSCPNRNYPGPSRFPVTVCKREDGYYFMPFEAGHIHKGWGTHQSPSASLIQRNAESSPTALEVQPAIVITEVNPADAASKVKDSPNLQTAEIHGISTPSRASAHIDDPRSTLFLFSDAAAELPISYTAHATPPRGTAAELFPEAADGSTIDWSPNNSALKRLVDLGRLDIAAALGLESDIDIASQFDSPEKLAGLYGLNWQKEQVRAWGRDQHRHMQAKLRSWSIRTKQEVSREHELLTDEEKNLKIVELRSISIQAKWQDVITTPDLFDPNKIRLPGCVADPTYGSKTERIRELLKSMRDTTDVWGPAQSAERAASQEKAKEVMRFHQIIGNKNWLLLSLADCTEDEVQYLDDTVHKEFAEMSLMSLRRFTADHLKYTSKTIERLSKWCDGHQVDIASMSVLHLCAYLRDQKMRGASVARSELSRMKFLSEYLGWAVTLDHPFVREVAMAPKSAQRPKQMWPLLIVSMLENWAVDCKSRGDREFSAFLRGMCQLGVRFRDCQRMMKAYFCEDFLAFYCFRAKAKGQGADLSTGFCVRMSKESIIPGLQWWKPIELAYEEDPNRDFFFGSLRQVNQNRKASDEENPLLPATGPAVNSWFRRRLLSDGVPERIVFLITLHGGRRFWITVAKAANTIPVNEDYLLGFWSNNGVKVMPALYSDDTLIRQCRIKTNTLRVLTQYLSADKSKDVIRTKIAEFTIEKFSAWVDQAFSLVRAPIADTILDNSDDERPEDIPQPLENATGTDDHPFLTAMCSHQFTPETWEKKRTTQSGSELTYAQRCSLAVKVMEIIRDKEQIRWPTASGAAASDVIKFSTERFIKSQQHGLTLMWQWDPNTEELPIKARKITNQPYCSITWTLHTGTHLKWFTDEKTVNVPKQGDIILWRKEIAADTSQYWWQLGSEILPTFPAASVRECLIF